MAILFVQSFSQTAVPKEGCAPLTVNFTAPAGYTSWFWDFGDGATSVEQNPVNPFSTPGVYIVKFRAKVGDPIAGTDTIRVYPKPVPDVASVIGCAPLNVTFDNKTVIPPGIKVLKYTWGFGDNQIGEGTTPTHFYGAPGTYQVDLEIQTNLRGCNITQSFKDLVTVLTPPVASFTTNPPSTITCNDSLNVLFADNSIGARPMTYTWNFGNGKTFSGQTPPAAQHYGKGQYTAMLQVAYTNISNCSAAASTTVSVGRPTPNIKALKDTVCMNSVDTIFTTTPGLYQWDPGPNASVMKTFSDDTLLVSWNTPGFHTVSLTITSFDGQCSDSKTVKIYVDEVTAAITSPDPTFHCESPATIHYTGSSNQTKVKYLWMLPGDTTQYKTKSVTKAYISGSDTIYYDVNRLEDLSAGLIVTSTVTGCIGTAGRTDSLWLPNARFMPDVTKGCTPLTVHFSDSSSTFWKKNKLVKWEWIFGDNTPNLIKSDSNIVAHTYTTAGEYYAKLVVTSEMGCVDTSYAVLIQVGKDLTSSIDFTISKSQVCPGEATTFQANVAPAIARLIDAYHFYSEDNRVFHCGDQDHVNWSYNDLTGPQDVTLTVDYNGCLSPLQKAAAVTVKGVIAKIDYYALCSKPLEYNFQSKSTQNGGTDQTGLTLAWNFGDSKTASGVNAVHHYASRGAYSVTLTASNSSGCPATTAVADIIADSAVARITMDTAICVKSDQILNAGKSERYKGPGCHRGYTWQFPDVDMRPYTSDDTVTSKINFPAGGVQRVRLIVEDANGCKDTATQRIKVYDMQVSATVNPNKPICLPATVTFTNTTHTDTTVASYTWYFGDDPNPGSAKKDPDPHTYTFPNAPGQYNVVLFVKDVLGCQERFGLNIDRYVPLSTISIDDQFLCAGQMAHISASDFKGPDSLKYSWDFGNGVKSITTHDTVITYTKGGDFPIRLVYTEKSSGCTAEADALIQVQDYPKAGMISSADTMNVLCAPRLITFTDTSRVSNPPLSYYWDFGNGITVSGIDKNNTYVTYEKGKWTTIHAVITSFGCSDTIRKSFELFKPEADFTISPNPPTICKGDTLMFNLISQASKDLYSFEWAFGDGIIDSSQSASVAHKYNFHPPSGKTIATLIARGKDGICPTPYTKEVFIYEVVPDFLRENEVNGDTSICFSEGPFHFKNNSTNADTYLWKFGDGQTFNAAEPGTHTYARPDTFNVTLTITNKQYGCTDSITKQAVIYQNPKMLIEGDTGCLGGKLYPKLLNPIPAATIKWTPSTGLSYDSIAAPEATLLHSVRYNVVETDTNGCSDQQTIPAIVIEPLNLHDWDTSIVVGDQIALPVHADQPVYIYKWNPEDGLSCLTCDYPKVRPLKDIVYNLHVTDVLGCFTNDVVFKIEVKPNTFVKLPTAFTPNGDGSNDIVYVKGWGIKDLLEFKIFNRWGELIYSSTDINEGWDGKFKGQVQNSDAYVYKVKVLTWRDEVISDEGYINLLH